MCHVTSLIFLYSQPSVMLKLPAQELQTQQQFRTAKCGGILSTFFEVLLFVFSCIVSDCSHCIDNCLPMYYAKSRSDKLPLVVFNLPYDNRTVAVWAYTFARYIFKQARSTIAIRRPKRKSRWRITTWTCQPRIIRRSSRASTTQANPSMRSCRLHGGNVIRRCELCSCLTLRDVPCHTSTCTEYIAVLVLFMAW